MRPVPEAHALSREELVKLVQFVFLLPRQDSPKVVVFAAAASGNGCSSICAGAAEALAAQVEQPVCVVDSNLRYPSLHLCFDMENRRGLCEALSSEGPIRKYVRKLSAPNLWLLPSGLKSSPVSGTMSYTRLAARISELRQEFSYVLMDSPPINLFSDGIALGQSADGVILVISANSTRRKAARNAKDCLQGAGARLLGVVLNNRTYPIPQAMYDRF
jgi:capsular exopolysaccharide synthesis family protein